MENEVLEYMHFTATTDRSLPQRFQLESGAKPIKA